MGVRNHIADWLFRAALKCAGRPASGHPAPSETDWALQTLFRDSIDQMAEGVLITDAAGHLVYANPQWHALLPELSDAAQPGVATTTLWQDAADRGLFSAHMTDGLENRMSAGADCSSAPLLLPLAVNRSLQVRSSSLNATGGTITLWTDISTVQSDREVLQSLIDNMPELVVLKDRQGRYVIVNRCFEDWTTSPRSQIIGKTVQDIYTPEQALLYEERDSRVVATGETDIQEMEMAFPDGVTRQVILITFPVLGTRDHIFGSGVIGIDVTRMKKVEKDLREKQMQLNLALETMASGLMMVDQEGIIRAINSKLVEMYALPEEDARVGGLLESLVAFRAGRGDYGAGDQQEVVDKRLTMWRTAEDLVYEDPLPEGRIAEVQRQIVPGGGSLILCSDITERNRITTQLQRRTNQMRLLRDTAQLANETATLGEALQAVLAQVCRHRGWPAGHAYLRSSSDPDMLLSSGLVFCEDGDPARSFLRGREGKAVRIGEGAVGRTLSDAQCHWAAVEEGDPMFDSDGGDNCGLTYGVTCPVISANRTVAVIEFFNRETTEPGLFLMETMRQVGIQIGHVAERQEAETKLRLSEEYLRLAVSFMDGGLFLFDRDLNIKVMSPQFSEIYNVPPELVEEGRSAIPLIRFRAQRGDYGEDDTEKLVRRRIEGYRDRKLTKIEDRLPDGRIIELIRAPTNDGGVVAVFHDVTERKKTNRQIREQRDELDRLNRQKSRFFSIIAHDLRGPFGTLLTYLELLSQNLRSSAPDKLESYVENADQAGRQVYALLENLLEWSALQMEGIEAVPECVQLLPMLRENHALFAASAGEKDIELTLSEGLDELKILGDSRAIDTVLRNLISNAIKFTPRGGTVHLDARIEEGVVVVDIRDSGTGMSPEMVERLFHPDEKTSMTGTSGELGTGLGLLLCRELVEKNGGSIQVESTPDEGSVFRVRFPACGPGDCASSPVTSPRK